MLNELRQRVTTYPGTVQVVTTPGASCNESMIDLWDALNSLYHMHYIITFIIITKGYYGTFRGDFSI